MTPPASPFASALPAGRPFDVVGVGVAVVDHLFLLRAPPAPHTRLDAVATTRQGGGVVATALVAAARLGLRPDGGGR